ncbi:predicted protein [Streptomyces viridochromogenes DSM 40736]|uniref:Predicted protein n=1 Tax=Streptomyces viridochromogenes (strain DSM 40736 / JCM 4977 / BCRC 1201 / Tue 494) TaxID=591159 RepID=D9X2B3_STRVT|nr:hypothetical protein [Streptomyces viridochromogenes]EFL33582.1 predicted protein [Streptomyces viridochromogenes DSM 40736]
MLRSKGAGFVVAGLVLAVGGCGSGGTHEDGGSNATAEAADGDDFAACSDGACEVLVTSTADITANGVTVHVSVDDSVTFRTPGTITNLGGRGGVAQFGFDLKVKVVAHHGKTAVLEFAVP